MRDDSEKTTPVTTGTSRSKGLSRREALRAGLGSVGLMLAGCGGSPSATPERDDGVGGANKSGKRPNIVLVCVDTLRTERLHCYGNPRLTSPCIDRLAREGVLYDAAFAPTPWTLPSHLSLFTSRNPGRYLQGVTSWQSLPFPIAYQHQQGDPTIASVLQDQGYDTVGFYGAILAGGIFGLGHGFRIYDWSLPGASFSRANQYLREKADDDQPFFLFVHTYVTHRPYRHENIFGSGLGARPRGLREMDFTKETLGEHEIAPIDPQAALYAWTPEPEEIEYFKTVYDGGVRYADMLMETLVATLKETSQYENTLIVVTSDHGEEFWEHVPEQSPGHDHSLFDELLRVPLILKFPGGRFAGERSDQLVRLIDVAPTVLELAGVSREGLGLSGESLLPDLTGGRATDERTLFGGYTFMGPMRYCVRTLRYKYIYCPQTLSFKPHIEVPAEALYDLQADPKELRNIAGSQPELTARLRLELERQRAADLPLSMVLDDSQVGRLTRQYLPALGLVEHGERLIARGEVSPALPPGFFSPELIEQLRALGYGP